MTHSETLASAIQAAWRGEPMPEPGSPAQEALIAAIRATQTPESLHELAVLTVKALIAHLQADLVARRAMLLMSARGEPPVQH